MSTCCADLIDQPQHRNEIAQRRQFAVVEAVRAPGQPVGIETVHLSERAGLAEPVDEAQHMPVAFFGQFGKHRKAKLGVIGQIDQQLIMAVFEHVKEDRAAPILAASP